MSRIKSLKKEQRLVRRVLRRLNKQLKEDCFAGRFEVRQKNRVSTGRFNGWCSQTFIDPLDLTNFGIAGHGYHLWYYAVYEVEFIDNEEPERNYSQWFELHDIIHGFLGGTDTLSGSINKFIVESDFWDKWKDSEYARTHWFSGQELKSRIKYDKKWKSIDDMISSHNINRWNNENNEDEEE